MSIFSILPQYSATGDKINVVATDVEAIDSMEVKRTGKNRQWVWVGLVFVAGGLLLGLMSLFFLSSLVSTSLMAISLGLIGIVFMLSYIGGKTGEVIARTDAIDVKCKMRPNALDDMARLVQRFYELRLGYVSKEIEYRMEWDQLTGRDGDARGLTLAGDAGAGRRAGNGAPKRTSG